MLGIRHREETRLGKERAQLEMIRRAQEATAQQQRRIAWLLGGLAMLVGGSILGLIAWINHYQSFIKEEWTVTDAAGKLCQDGTMLKKPYDPKTLLDRIKRLLAARARREAG